MSEVTFCDRCDKVAGRGRERILTSQIKGFDLCNDCKKSFKKWLDEIKKERRSGG
jgi:hypothetical protein